MFLLRSSFHTPHVGRDRATLLLGRQHHSDGSWQLVQKSYRLRIRGQQRFRIQRYHLDPLNLRQLKGRQAGYVGNEQSSRGQLGVISKRGPVIELTIPHQSLTL